MATMPVSKKEMILLSATNLFASKGYDGTSVREIAEGSGLSVPGMFHYFPSKEEILCEIIKRSMEEVYEGLRNIYKSKISPVEKLENVCKFYVEYYASHKNQLTILGSERKALSDEHRTVYVDKQRLYVNILKRLFNELNGEGKLKDLNSSVIAFIFFGMVHWTSIWYSPQGKLSPNELGDVISEVFLRGILKE